MVCKKCGNVINAGDEACSKCGEKISPESFKKSNFSVKIPQKELKRENLDNDLVRRTAALQNLEEKAADENDKEKNDEKNDDEKDAKTVIVLEKSKDEVAEENVKATTNESSEEAAKDSSEEKTEEKTELKAEIQKPKIISQKQPSRKVSKAKAKEEKKIKTSYIAVKVICCVCAVLTIALSCVGIFTDYFKMDLNATKTVALTRLSENDEKSFEQYIIKLSSLYGKNIDCSQMNIYDLLELLKPGSANGLYSGFFKKAEVITKKADPAVRFADSADSFRYCKIKADDVKTIASSFGIRLINSANNSDCYYYSQDGYYYFSAEKSKDKNSEVSVTVSDSKRTEDGSYYIECDVQNAECEKIYCLVKMKKTDGLPEWQLLKISDKAMFADDGTQISEKTSGSIPYEMKYTKITAKTKDSVTYAQYEISYPVFDAENGTEQENRTAMTINLLYSDLIKAYEDKANEADKNYADYTRRGYVKSLLPGTVKIVSSVKYNRNGYISLLDEISEYSPTEISKAAKKVVTDAAKEGIKKSIKKEVVVPTFSTLTYSGYTLNIETGEFVKKDEIFGKDYRPFRKKLYKVYRGYDADAEIEFEDDGGIGRDIYSSTWVLSDEGVGFCYQNPLVYNDFVVLPYKNIDKEF